MMGIFPVIFPIIQFYDSCAGLFKNGQPLSAQPSSSSRYEPQRGSASRSLRLFTTEFLWLIIQVFVGYRLLTHTQVLGSDDQLRPTQKHQAPEKQGNGWDLGRCFPPQGAELPSFPVKNNHGYVPKMGAPSNVNG